MIWCIILAVSDICRYISDLALFLFTGEIRLAGGGTFSEGRVEIFTNGEWGTVCDDHWDIHDATVVCKEIGFPSAVSAVRASHFGEGSGPIHIDDVECSGRETSIFNCRHRAGGSSCDHSRDAGVVCTSPGKMYLPFPYPVIISKSFSRQSVHVSISNILAEFYCRNSTNCMSFCFNPSFEFHSSIGRWRK